ncbi:alpha-mannosidase [Diplocloster hominis]|uniref:alpha-mannosidase n=1 Tax=Diplocloster hominis TaxID=3079010 RepID=UPI0031BBCA19
MDAFTEKRIEKILGVLESGRRPVSIPAAGWRFTKRHFPVSDRALVTGTQNWDREPVIPAEWEECTDNRTYEGMGTYYAFWNRIPIAKDLRAEHLELVIETGPEGRWDASNPQGAVYINGELAQGLDVNHTSVFIKGKDTGAAYTDGPEYCEVLILLYSGEEAREFPFHARLCAVDDRTEEFYYDLLVPWQCARLMEKEETQYQRLMEVLNGTVNRLDLRRIGSREYYDSLKEADRYLMGALEDMYSMDKMPQAYCVGHTHIDIAWLWTVEVTREKAARSFSTVLSLMNRYPEYRFLSSQPILYEFVKENQPELYGRIQKRIEEGRWEAEGGMYLEPDCTLTSGESLVRQLLYGIGFFEKEFGKKSRILWLPDTFGFCGTLPQIMRQCGINWFATTKISWNETNRFPYDTFYWEGIDGSRVLAHMIPTRDYETPGRRIRTDQEHHSEFTTNYNGCLNPAQIKGGWQRYQQKSCSSGFLCSYGYGDGGGGPTQDMLETEKRLRRGMGGCPCTRLSTAGQFFAGLERELSGNPAVPVWSGELYLEYHRGTYTSVAKNKRLNRKHEFHLLNLECLLVLAEQYLQLPYPAKEMEAMWRILMQNQFHDILPGSAIKEVYENSWREYDLLEQREEVLEKRISDRLNVLFPDGGVLIYNPNGFEDSCLVQIPGDGGFGTDGTAVKPGDWIVSGRIPAKGCCFYTDKELEQRKVKDGPAGFSVEGRKIKTPWYSLEFDENGWFQSIYDSQNQRELVPAGRRMNVLTIYEDIPYDFDNWNLYSYYRDKAYYPEAGSSFEVRRRDSGILEVYLTWKYQSSRIEETIRLYKDSRRIDISAEIDWQESRQFLKAEFPVDINSREAVFDIPYGNITRSTTENTSWDQAKFEVPYQKWMDISEGGFGISFLNDCKYGVSIRQGVVGLSLVKSGGYPYPEADRGRHRFIYSIYPHAGDFRQGGTVREAYRLNNPMQLVRITAGCQNAGRHNTGRHGSQTRHILPGRQAQPGGISDLRLNLVAFQADNIILEAVKKSEDGRGYIFRFYECYNQRSGLRLNFTEKYSHVYRCNLLEEPVLELEAADQVYIVDVRPYEIFTIKCI